MGFFSDNNLTDPQNELYEWIKDYMKDFQHSPSIRQMMQAMGLKSPAPIQSRLKHLQDKGYIKSGQELFTRLSWRHFGKPNFPDGQKKKTTHNV